MVRRRRRRSRRNRNKRKWGQLAHYRRKYGRTRIQRLPVGGYPKSMLMRLRYVTSVVVDCPANSLADHLFRCNGMYDPDQTGIGHQPLGFDQAMSIYDHYTVVGAKIKVSLQNTLDSRQIETLVPGAWGLLVTDTNQGIASRYTSTENLLENIETTSGMVRYTQAGNSLAPSKKPILSRNFSAKKFFGVGKIVGDDLYRGTNASNPQEEAFFRVWVGSMGLNNPYAARFLVELEYLAVFTERKLIPAS